MKEDFQKFLELVKTDEALQKKLEEAGRNYDGEQTEEAVFHAVLEPIAKEAGFSLTLDDMKQSVQELNLDEMSQVAGGDYGAGGGVGLEKCEGIGLGWGWSAGAKDGGLSSGGACFFIGGGWGFGLCTGVGLTNDLKNEKF